MIALVVCGVGGAAAQGAAFGLALTYANGLETGRSFDLCVGVATPQEDLWALYAVGVAVTVSLLGAVILLYWFQAGAVRLSKDYEEFCVRRTLSLVSQLPHPYAPRANERLETKYIERILNDARLCGRVLRLLTNSVVPFVVTPATLVIMFALNPVLSAIVGLLAVVGATWLYRVNVKGARASNKMEQLSRESSQQRREAIERALQTGSPLSYEDRELKRLTQEGPSRQRLDAYADRLEAVEESGLVTGTLAAVALGAILTVEGRSILQGGGSVSLLVGYLAVLRLFVTNFMRLGRTVSGVSRFYPQIRRHYEFTDDASSANAEPRSGAGLPVNVHTSSLESEDPSVTPLKLVEGSRIGVLSGLQLDRALLAKLGSVISPEGSTEGSARLRLSTSTLPQGGTIREAFGFPVTVEDPREVMTMGENASSFVGKKLEEVGSSLARSGHGVHVLEENDRLALSFIAGVLAEPHIVVVSNQQWQQIPPDLREDLDSLAGHLVVAYVGTVESEEFPLGPAAPVIVANDERVAGWCSHEWVQHNRSVIRDSLKASSRMHGPTSQSATEDEEEVE